MRKEWTVLAAAVGVSAALAAPAGLAAADDGNGKSAQQVISELQSQGYTVHIDRIGTAPMSQCVVTNVRNPQSVQQWVPYIGPGDNGDDRALVLDTVSQSISVSLDCNRR